ncbi:MAG: hypothetical protein H0W87_05195 [Actinobacteria bacterium]|nr:hypothetical protein [Actinomycetota bacterium]
MSELQNKKVAFLATHMVEQVELTEPWKAVEAAGGTPELVSLEAGPAFCRTIVEQVAGTPQRVAS